MLSLTQPLQNHQCRVRASPLQPPWTMALLGQGWQEKVGLLQASGSTQGGDQTQGSLEEQGRASSIVLHGAEAAEITEWGLPARAQAVPAPVPHPSSRAALWRGLSHGAGLLRTHEGTSPAAPSQCPFWHIQHRGKLTVQGGAEQWGSHAQSIHTNKKRP